MTDIVAILPDFDLRPYAHVLPSLEKALVYTTDFLIHDAVHLAKRAQLPPTEVRKLADALLEALHCSLPVPVGATNTGERPSVAEIRWISTLDDALDASLGGKGIPTGCLTEIVGESAAGKTQLLLTLLLSAQLQSDSTSDGTHAALYISTEAPLQTSRLMQFLNNHPALRFLSPGQKPTLSRIHSTHIHDLEAQDHILRYQVPVAIAQHNIGLLVIDSIAANFRAEFDKPARNTASAPRTGGSLAKRSAQVSQMSAWLRRLAREHNVAVVVANQVADRFAPDLPPSSAVAHATSQPSSHPLCHTALPQDIQNCQHTLSTPDPLTLDHQQRFFTGWGDTPMSSTTPEHPKTPSLGLTWTNQLAARVALLKEPRRICKVVFSNWCPPSEETEFEIWEGGVRGVLR